MSLKITITLKDGRKVKAKLPYEHASDAVTDVQCPNGGHFLAAHGIGTPQVEYDTMTSPARCCGCGERIGTITVKVNTLFGIEEDERMLNGRFRVY